MTAPAFETFPGTGRRIPPGQITGPHLANIAGLSYETVHRWTVSGYLKTSTPANGSGSRRTYPASEVEIARTLDRVRRSLGHLPEHVARIVAAAARDGRTSAALSGSVVLSW